MLAKFSCSEAESAQFNQDEKTETEARWKVRFSGLNSIIIYCQLPLRELFASFAIVGYRTLEEGSIRKLYALAKWMLPLYRVDPWPRETSSRNPKGEGDVK